MTPSSARETGLLQRQMHALEREVEHLKGRLTAAADEIAKRDRIISDQHWRLTNRSHRW